MLKAALSEELALAYPICGGGEFYLDTDACDVAIGAALHQEQGDKLKLLRFGSRCLNAAERNYSTTRKELLAVVFFMTYFRHYLIGAKVRVRTDHGSLTWLKRMKNPSGQVARWIEKLAPFDWKIEHRAGKLHTNADSLSRRPCDGSCKQCVKIYREHNPLHHWILTLMIPG